MDEEWDVLWARINAECDEWNRKRQPLKSSKDKIKYSKDKIIDIFGASFLWGGFFFWSLVWFLCQCIFAWDLHEVFALPFALTTLSGLIFFGSFKDFGKAYYEAIRYDK